MINHQLFQIKASKLLDMPVVVTEQYPKGNLCKTHKLFMLNFLTHSNALFFHLAFGHTVAELDISDAAVCAEKTKFSMYLPEVVDVLKKHNTKSILLLGIEV